MHTEHLANTLRRIAASLSTDAEELIKFAGQLDTLTDAELKNTAIASNVASLICRTMNNSSWVGAAESALYTSTELVRGRD